MATLSRLRPGQVLYNVRRVGVGNTTMKTDALYEVRVIEVHADHVVASWNGNPARVYYPAEVKRWRPSKPKKLNGHEVACRWSHGPSSWGAECTCKREESRRG